MLQRLISDAGTVKRDVTATYASLPLRRLGQPDDIAKMFAFLLSDDASFITGMVYPVDGGAMA
jgi:NAD(P)-dependent dehydrogenase (short-subunit alcohol dehydrogenase family)